MKKWLSFILVLCILLPAFAIAEGNTLRVEGVAVITVQPDQAILHVGYAEENEQSKLALQRAASVIAKVTDAVQALGIEEENIKTESIQTYPSYDKLNDAQTTTYRVEYMLAITVNDLTQMGDVLDTIFQAGANKIYDITYSSSNEDDQYQEALKQAVKKAAAKAEAMALAAGLWLGEITQISESSYYRPQYSRQMFETGVMAAKDDAVFGGGMFTPSNLEITANVSVEYSIR